MAAHRGRTRLAELVRGVLTVAWVVVTWPLSRRRHNRHGATDDEVAADLPGDELVVRPRLGYTRAVTVDSPPESVWPWLAQIGQGRGGFYSFDEVENLVGCDIHSADEIVPEHVEVRVGDVIRSGRRDAYACWVVMDVDPPRHLVLEGAGTPREVRVPPVVDEVPDRGYVASTWQWVLRPVDGGRRTRVIVRQRLTFSPRQRWFWYLIEPFNFAMEREMLRGLKGRAERRPVDGAGDLSRR